MEARIRQLSASSTSAVIVEERRRRRDGGHTGAIVTLRYEGDDDIEQYLVGSIEERRDEHAGRLPGSPLGRAAGPPPGDTVSYEAPSGSAGRGRRVSA